MVLNCEAGKICWKSPGCECVGCSPHAVLNCPCSHHRMRGLRNSETANLRHRNGAGSFPDVFFWTTYGLRAEWLLTSRVAMQEAALAWGRARELQRSVGSQQLLRKFRHHLSEAEPHPLAAQRPGSGALETEVSHQMSAVAWGDVRTPQPGLIHFLKATALYQDEPGSKVKKSQQHPIPQSRTMTEFSFTSPSRPSGSPDHDILKVNDQHKVFLEAGKHGARNSIKECFTKKNYLLLFS